MSLAREKAIQAKEAKRAAPDPSSEPISKRARLEVDQSASTVSRANDQEEDGDNSRPAGLPVGFFSAGNRPSISDAGGDDGEADRGKKVGANTVVKSKADLTGDTELDDFLASLEDVSVDQVAMTASTPTPAVVQRKKGYFSSSTLDTPGVASYAAAPVLLNQGTDNNENEAKLTEPEETEAEKRERAAREEREEIMGRLEEEERAQ